MKSRLTIALIICLNMLLFAQSRYTVERTINGGAKNVNQRNFVIFNVIDDDNRSLFTVSKNVDYDIPYPEAKVFDDGSLAIIWSIDASIEYYNSTGDFVDHVFLMGRNNIEYERAVYAAVDASVLASVVMDGLSAGSEVFITDKEGVILNDWVVGSDNISGVAYSAARGSLIISGYDYRSDALQTRTTFHDLKGVIKAEIPFLFDSYYFSGNSSLFFTGATGNAAFTFDFEKMDVIDAYKTTSGKIILDAVHFDNILSIVVAGKPSLKNGEWFYSEANLLQVKNSQVVDESKLDLSKKFASLKLSPRADDLYISVDGETIKFK